MPASYKVTFPLVNGQQIAAGNLIDAVNALYFLMTDMTRNAIDPTSTITVANIQVNNSTNHGVVIGGGNTGVERYTTPGTSGQYLTSNGPAADPSFQALVLPDAGPGAGGPYNNFTIDIKGRVATASLIAYLTGNQTITLTGDVAGSGATAITTTLATVNGSPGTYNNVTVNGKGLATSGSNVNYARYDATNTWTADQNFNSKQINNAYLFNYDEIAQTVTAASTTSIDLSLGNIIILNQATSITTLTFTNPPASGRIKSWTIYRVKDNSATARTITWPATVKWGAGATAPTPTATAVSVDEYVLRTIDGGATYYTSYKLAVNT